MKVQAKHGKVTQNMHGASKNYRYVWDVSYPHLQRNFSCNGAIDRPNPKIPSLEKIDEVLFVNTAEQIRPDTFSDEDSHTSKHEDDPLDDSDLELLQAPMNIEEIQSPASVEGSTSEDASSSGEDRQPSPQGVADA